MWYSGGQTRVIANKLNYWAEEGMMSIFSLQTSLIMEITIG